MRIRWTNTFLAFLVLIISTTACSSGIPVTSPASTTTLNGTTPAATTTLSSASPAATTTSDGATLVQERCTRCHSLINIERSKHTAAEWKLLVDMMISRGAKLTSDEETVVVNYLATNFGK